MGRCTAKTQTGERCRLKTRKGRRCHLPAPRPGDRRKSLKPPGAHAGTLTVRQRLFVDAYFACKGNVTQAAIKAGYSPRSAAVTGHRLLKLTKIAVLVEERQRTMAAALQVTTEEIARELYLLGFSNAADYYRLSDDGEPIVDLSELTRDQSAAIQEFQVEDYIEGRGPTARAVRRVRIKTECKRPALVDLAKLLGLMPERVEHTGAGGGPITTQNVQLYLPDNQRTNGNCDANGG